MTAPLRWGILGTGNIARQFVEGLRGARRGVAVAVGSRTAEKAAAFVAANGVSDAAAHGDYAALIADPRVEAVYVSLPNSMHHEWTLKALAAGKHVLCEKPLASNLTQANEMFDAARRHGRVLIEAFMYRSHPLTHAVLAAVRSGAVGEVRTIRASFCFKVNKPEGNIRFSSELAGGALMDIGCYCLSYSRLLAGCEPTHASAFGRLHASGVDEITACTLKFPGDLLATFICGMSVHADNTLTVGGSEGYLEVPVPWKPPVAGAAYVLARSIPPRMDLPSQKVSASPPQRQTFTIDADRPLYALEADDFAAVVRDGTRPAVTPEDSLANMKWLDELRRQVGVR